MMYTSLYNPGFTQPIYYPPPDTMINVNNQFDSSQYRFKEKNNEEEINKKIELEKLALKTIKEIEQLKEELSNLQNKKNKKENSVDSIINKYKSDSIDKEIKIFNGIFKNYNSTNTKQIDVKAINNKIKNSIKNKENHFLKPNTK